ncbi:MAG: ribbon-helix-helix domain-containing protein [bacterium]
MAKVLISMPSEFLNKIDNFAAFEQRTRSELIREALRSYIRKNPVIDTKLSEKRAKILEDLLE